MRRDLSTISLVLLVGVALGLAIANAASLGRNEMVSAKARGTRFEARVRTHESRTEELGFPRVSEVPAEAEIEIPPPTRSSFMASWNGATGARGYLLDVSTDRSFNSYVNDYHDVDVGNVTGRVVTSLNPGTTYYYRVRPYNANGAGNYSEVMTVTTVATTGLTIHATFDSSITGNTNAAAIEAMINRAIAVYESMFGDPFTIEILFRYSTTAPNGDPLPANRISQSSYVYYTIPWNSYINALSADAKTSNDDVANASLPGVALSPNVNVSSAGGRAIGLSTPPDMNQHGELGGPYDGIVTINSGVPFQFNRPVSASNLDAQRLTEHEIDEVIGFASHIGHTSDLFPQDLFSWSSAGQRNVSSSGTRYFSVNGGNTRIVDFNQNANGDFGDWLSEACPQPHPYVQNAFSCTGQSSDIAATSPEGINLDVIGYDLVNATTPTGPPVVATNPATDVTSSSATLNGTVNPKGLATAVHFQHGTTTNYGSSTASQNYNGSTTQNFNANISGLIENTTYHFRIVATNSDGTSYGIDRSFTARPARAAVADFNGDSHPD
ncbi:MAG: hypothetical protein C5B58_02595, partial [Acidobacteria bacterium]